MTVSDGASRAAVALTDLASAREALSEEWAAASPETVQEVAAFYRVSERIEDELRAWHETAERQKWTSDVCYVAKQIEAKLAIDIGCGIGNELRALEHEAGVETVVGVEPNDAMRRTLEDDGIPCHADVTSAAQVIADADLILCLDVLEHVPDPEAFIGAIARSAKIGAVLVESTATFDISTPLHLKGNWGWHPGHALELAGWDLLGEPGPAREIVQATGGERLRCWRRMKLQAPERTGLLVCVYRHYSVGTANSVLALVGGPGWEDWRVTTKTGDGLVSRARGVVVSRWYRETADDVFLMLDDDISFTPDAADRVVQLCREKRSVVVAAYPVRDGTHLALRRMHGTPPLQFGPDVPPIEIQFGATGFMAVHRDVIDALVPTVQLCQESDSWAFWPIFADMIYEEPNGTHSYLSEDWAFCVRAQQAGFKIWLDPSVHIDHLATAQINVRNMRRFRDFLKDED